MLARAWFNSLLAAALRFSWFGFDLYGRRFVLHSTNKSSFRSCDQQFGAQ
jgi:hypothetical protein